MLLIPSRARAYVYSGRWVADCPRGCGNAELLCELDGSRVTMYRCSYCQYFTSDVDWPAEAAELMAVLLLRPVPHTRNWYPEDHDLAVRAGIPHGQTVAGLLEENVEHGVGVS